MDKVDGAMFLVRATSIQKLVSHHGQGPEVRLGAVDVGSAEHLGSQVLLGAARKSAGQCTVESGAVGGGVHMGDAEIGQVGPAAVIQDDVLCGWRKVSKG